MEIIFLSKQKIRMKHLLNYSFWIFILTFPSYLVQGQEITSKESEEEALEESEGPLRIGFLLMHTYIPTETSKGRELLVLPSIGLDIEYWFSERFGIGMHNDIELESFEVEKEEAEIIERAFPFVLTLDGLFKIGKKWVLVLGGGVELEADESFALFRTGIEYEVNIGPGWDLSPSFAYDFRVNAFDTWSVGLGLGYRF